MSNIIDIEGIGKVYATKLRAAGIATVEELLEKGASRHGREAIEKATGISHKRLLRWVNIADLWRIKGCGEEYTELLEAAGVDSIPELAQRVPGHLHEKLVEANEARKLVRKLPTAQNVADWVHQAKTMPRVVTH
jgi:predicted flap endonuclease-1-like 5' DNA nuclease